MPTTATHGRYPTRDEALKALVVAAVENIPGVNSASISVIQGDEPPRTIASTDSTARRADELQYELHEGPCYAAITTERFALIDDIASSPDFPRYASGVLELGLEFESQIAIQLLDGKNRAGLNLYAGRTGTFSDATVHVGELYATQVASLLGYAEQVEQLHEALHTRTDIGIAVGILMERYDIHRHQAFSYLLRTSQTQNVKVRVLARQILNRPVADKK